jgi:4-hydroxythreonine-4-phosphate dehydrogenase
LSPPPPVGITLGDPAGIGPEIVVRALAARPELDVRVYGDEGLLRRAAGTLGLPPIPVARIAQVTHVPPDDVVPGQPNATTGRAQVKYLMEATRAALSGEVAALVTAPLSKEWAGKAGFAFPGHTEYLADAAGVRDFAMMLAGPRLRVTVATTHIPLAAVPEALTVEGIASAILLTSRALADEFGVVGPRVAVAGLNPHAGEAGKFGDEEARLVEPAMALAIERLVAEGRRDVTVTGPHVPDVVFRRAASGEFDAVVAMYHDQGLIPLKLLHFDDGVNVTLGLPFVRTSPDHGTAYDIAGTGRARPTSFLAALDLAADLARRRRQSRR